MSTCRSCQHPLLELTLLGGMEQREKKARRYSLRVSKAVLKLKANCEMEIVLYGLGPETLTRKFSGVADFQIDEQNFKISYEKGARLPKI